MELALIRDGKYLVPYDWRTKGSVLCVHGSTPSGYLGFGTLSRTPDAVVLATPMGVEAVVLLTDISDITVCKFEGIMIERNTSIGPMYSALPYPHGFELVASGETNIRLRLRLVTLSANAAAVWSQDIRQAAYEAQIGILTEMMPIKRQMEIK